MPINERYGVWQVDLLGPASVKGWGRKLTGRD